MVANKGVMAMWEGVFAPIPTPFLGEEIAWEQLESNLQRWAAAGLCGLVVLGSNGEFPLLATREKEQLVAFVCRHAPRGVQVLAGTSCESTRETLELTCRAGEMGADGVLLVNPYYYKNCYSTRVLHQYFTRVADASSVPVMLYNMPAHTGINLEPELVRSLSQHPNIAGIKDSSGNISQLAEIVSGVREDFAVFAGSADFFLAALAVGAAGGTLALANILPASCVRIYTAFRQERWEEARQLQLRVLDINHAVTRRWGPPGIKAALDMLGYFGGEPREPLLALGREEQEELRTLLVRGGFLAV